MIQRAVQTRQVQAGGACAAAGRATQRRANRWRQVVQPDCLQDGQHAQLLSGSVSLESQHKQWMIRPLRRLCRRARAAGLRRPRCFTPHAFYARRPLYSCCLPTSLLARARRRLLVSVTERRSVVLSVRCSMATIDASGSSSRDAMTIRHLMMRRWRLPGDGRQLRRCAAVQLRSRCHRFHALFHFNPWYASVQFSSHGIHFCTEELLQLSHIFSRLQQLVWWRRRCQRLFKHAARRQVGQSECGACSWCVALCKCDAIV